MRCRWKFLIAIMVIVCLLPSIIPNKPQLISSITTLDSAYLTILVDKREIRNIKKLEEKLVQMCQGDKFEKIKLQTEDKKLPEKLNISVYTSRKDLEKGDLYMKFTYNEGD